MACFTALVILYARRVDLTQLILRLLWKACSFRSDLFYRINVFPIHIPPLRERKEDIQLLLEYFIHRYSSRAGKHFRQIEKKSLKWLESYPWRGNYS
jgi:transcriptional regulator with PAS, ATPase and Fis domain